MVSIFRLCASRSLCYLPASSPRLHFFETVKHAILFFTFAPTVSPLALISPFFSHPPRSHNLLTGSCNPSNVYAPSIDRISTPDTGALLDIFAPTDATSRTPTNFGFPPQSLQSLSPGDPSALHRFLFSETISFTFPCLISNSFMFVCARFKVSLSPKTCG